MFVHTFDLIAVGNTVYYLHLNFTMISDFSVKIG